MANSVLNIIATIGGQATDTVSAAAPAFGDRTTNSAALRVTTDGFMRIQFAEEAEDAVATTASTMFAPGETIISTTDPLDFYSTLTSTGVANYSISLVTIDPVFGG